MRLFVLLFFLSSTVSAQTLPSPESVLGFQPGADFHLASYEDSIAYFEALDQASDRLTLVEVGKTSENRPFYVALISTADNLANAARYRDISLRLAHPQGLTDDEARQLAREGKAIVHIDGAVHATEVACHQHTIQLAYDLLTSEDPETHNVLDQVIFLLWPTLNPDGQTMVAEWYRENVGTSYEVAPLPRLYQKYVGHDNNRDAYMLNMIESRVVSRTWREWEPQIIYTQHQTAPFPTRIWLPPFAEPIANRVHPLMSRTVNSIGMLMAQALEERGQRGATHMGTGFDAWYPGYVDYLPMLRNAAAYWTETALYRYATPHFYTIADFPADRRELRSESLYPSPWMGGWWRLRDAVEYMVTTSTATLDFAAKFKEDLLYNRYQAGRDTISKYASQPPYAYFVPEDARDPVAPVELLRRLAFQGIRIYQLEQDATHGGMVHPAGTWVLPMDQEFAELARQVLEVQSYPDLREFPEGPPEQPYDAAGWTLPYQMGVDVIAASSPLTENLRNKMRLTEGPVVAFRDGELAVDAAPFDSVPGIGFDTDANAAGILPRPGELTGQGPAIAIDASQNNAFRAINRAWDEGASVSLDGSRFVIRGLGDAGRLVDELKLRAGRTQNAGTSMPRPRIGLYRPWNPSMDEGWTRWLLEQYEFEFVNITDADFLAGALARRFDVVAIAEPGRGSMVDGFPIGSVPPRYAGGLGVEGVRALDRFVRAGGTLVCLNAASQFAIDELSLPVSNLVEKLDRKEFYASGSIVEVEVDPTHPVMAGMPEQAKVFFSRSPVFSVKPGFEGRALAKYATSGNALLSGYLLGEAHLHGAAAALDVRHGDGHVLLIGFRPQWRGQPFGTFRVLMNAVLFHAEVASGSATVSEFWSPPAEDEQEDEQGASTDEKRKD